VTRVAVVGLGLIGGSVALAFRARGWDRDAAAREGARANRIDAVDELALAVTGADVVLLAVPSREVPEMLERVAALEPSAVLTDAASWKRPGIEAAGRLPRGVRYVAGHPMAGATASGASAARADLFAGRPWLLMRTARSDEDSLEAVASFVEGLGAIPRVVAAEVHDAAMTWVSHLPLAVAASLARAVERDGETGAGALAGPGLLDTTRLAETPQALAMELALADPERLAAAVEAVSKSAGELAGALRSGDAKAVERFLAEARQARTKIRPLT
jgi:prephenate dehydrogenase